MAEKIGEKTHEESKEEVQDAVGPIYLVPCTGDHRISRWGTRQREEDLSQ